MLAGASLLLVAIAFWMRVGMSSSAETAVPQNPDADVATLRRSLQAETSRLEALATAALSAPSGEAAAFAALSGLGVRGGLESVMLFENGSPLAWAGASRSRPDSISSGISVTRDAFFTLLHVVRSRGPRRAVASAVVAAEPPAAYLSTPIATAVNNLGLSRFRFALSPAADSATAGQPVVSVGERAILYARPTPGTPARMLYREALRTRARWGIILLAGYVLLLIVAWMQRRDLFLRLFTLGVGLALNGLVPWSEFSNTSRAFDPGFYFSRVGGPFTANAAALLVTVFLLLMAVFAISRARRRISISRPAAGILAVVAIAGGAVLASHIVRGVGQPSWGSTPGLWLSWELPVFLFVFSVVLAGCSLGRIAFGKSGTLGSRTIIAVAFGAAVLATGALWATTTRQRLRLAERDLAALTRVDESEYMLVERFVAAISASPAPKNSRELLRLYASSELSAAEFPVVLETRSDTGEMIARLDLAPGATDSSSIAYASAASLDSGATVSFLGPTGVQALARAVHPDGAVTTVLVLPHTRLVSAPPFASLLGLARHGGGDPPYTVTLAETSPGVSADLRHVAWQRIGDQWHGDRLIPTSAGTKRAHVEVDLRSFAARGERGVLIVLLDVLLAGVLWLAGAATEPPFARWLRGRVGRWTRTYRAKLTLALFAFFVVPAVTFASWSYQRLRSDDRQTRELLVNESLATIGEGSALTNLAAAASRLDAPVFIYSSGLLYASSDSLYASLAPGGVSLPPAVQMEIGSRGELTASAQEDIGGSDALIGYRAARGPNEERYILAAPARGDDIVLDRRRRDLGMLVLFATGLGAVAALALSGVAAKRLARDLELSRIEVARAERVIAWGEMARQVAHEIKNPLTPIRLGVQHLRRARLDNRPDFDRVLDENVGRILSEIDRLDSIARSFSRYGSAPADLLPAERLDVAEIVRDVTALEQMGKGEVRWKLRGADQMLIAMARGDELREVILNVLENARLAGARRVEITLREEEKRVTIEITDDGSGIPAAALPRIFEPHFSTRTTGSGLGLATSRRIIEHWGGEIAVTSQEAKGARVLIALVRPTG
ncbi:MAG: ATP-binding protein [Gemmatimonadota bacterium]|nr:ATP-binding protein [Gemmatimonadota bacterium]